MDLTMIDGLTFAGDTMRALIIKKGSANWPHHPQSILPESEAQAANSIEDSLVSNYDR